MRNAFVHTLHNLMARDPLIYILTADIGVFCFDEIRRDFPGRFLNTGVAEQNLMGIAAGLAMSGKIPFTFGIAPFVTMRCHEQIRTDICYQNLNVKIVSVGSGIVYACQGTTHHAIEDIAVMRALPHMKIFCPADPREAAVLTHAAYKTTGPVYLRLGRGNEENLPLDDYPVEQGKAAVLREGKDSTIIAHGLSVRRALDAAGILAEKGIDTTVLSMHTVKPIDATAVIRWAETTGTVITVEEHSIIGGLGSAVAEVLAEEGLSHVTFRRLGFRDTYCRTHADYETLLDEYNLSPHAIAEAVVQ